jgi:DNA-binding response OmpR family regulator
MLAIEHDWHLRKLIRANLEAMDLEVQEAVSGAHGLQLLHDSQPDLILLDLDLPGIDAIDLLQALHVQLAGRPVPILALSADPPSRETLEQGYIASYLRKPFAAPELLAQVRLVLNKENR